MRLFIRRQAEFFSVYKESVLKSIIIDGISCIVIILLFTLDIIFSKLVCHSFVFDILFAILFLCYITTIFKRNFKIKKKDQIIEEVKKFLEEEDAHK